MSPTTFSASPFSATPVRATAARACPVCGCRAVDEDEVEDGLRGDSLALAQCPRCEHRWTASSVRTVRVPRRVRREVASAA